MPQHTPLISTIVVGLVLAFVLGALANRLRIPPLVGYLVAGILIGPYTPGFVADQALADDLAEIGIILLMFGVGLHFTLDDLLSVRAIAVPGAIVQMVSATLLGLGLAHMQGWTLGAGLVFGLALSVASTVVLLKALQERRLVQTERGRIAIGWLVVEDLAMVLTLAVLPVVAGVLKGSGAADFASLAVQIAITVAKVAAFVAFMLLIGKRLIPWLLHHVAQGGSRELFRLAILAIALGVAYGASTVFDVSFALGAFFAGMILSESELSQRATSESLPLRDAFAVLFFVSVGMLFDPAILMRELTAVLATVLIIIVGKSVAAFLIVRVFGHATPTALTVAASLAQIGEFSFILAGLGVSLDLLSGQTRDLIFAGALISILLNPLLFMTLDWYVAKRQAVAASAPTSDDARRSFIPATGLTDHVVLVGHGRVGTVISGMLQAERTPLLVIEENEDVANKLRQSGLETISGNAADPNVLQAANLSAARCLLVAIPDALENGQVVARARAASPKLLIIARSHSKDESEHLIKHGASQVIMDEQEIARAMLAALPPLDAAGSRMPNG